MIHKSQAERRIRTKINLSVQRPIKYTKHIVATKKRLKDAEKKEDDKPFEECSDVCEIELFSKVYHDLELEGRGFNDHQNSKSQVQKMILELCSSFLRLFDLMKEKEGVKILKVLDSNFSVLKEFI